MTSNLSTPPMLTDAEATEPPLPLEPKPQDASAPRHFDFVDSLRGLAILGVLLVHVSTWVDKFGGRLRAFAAQGHLGVQLFFVVSAFTLFWSLRSRSSQDRRPLLAFYTRRFFRIAPLFYIAIPVYLVWPMVYRNGYAPAGVHWPHVLATVLFVHGWWPTTFDSVVPGDWSVGAEVMFYLCIPLLFARVRTLNGALWLTLVSAIGVGLASGPVEHHLARHFPARYAWLISTFVPSTFPAQLPVFCMGMVLYFLLAEQTTAGQIRVGGAVLAAGGLTAIFLPIPTDVLASIAFVVLAIGTARGSVRLLVNPVTRFIGMVSFSIYIWHFLVLEHIRRPVLAVLGGHRLHLNPSLQFCGLFLATLGVTVVVATVSYYVIEQPGQRAGRWVINSMGWGKATNARRGGSVVPI